ncbi:helix-turn-helix domain-containing protein [Streptococcus ovuberis]|uniref:Helix-turn-helix transcriptional regulator n=1 Tax=Streptococcus ovuberis TaxID=1936207 RepID=A0A7X6S151_9STRE|nr:helix-turn-helix transcriptional regulator [Streptococcus ovuberis]NKZ20015.1 helix-turn-helix transcriptional regulator [Streptococcus ovuberis]
MSQSITSYGTAFRKLRQQRGYKLKEAAEGIVSPQFLSRFERDLAGISIDKFGRLLVRIGASWNDFLRCYKGDSITQLISTLEDFNELYDARDFYQLAQSARNAVNQSYTDHNLLQRLINDMIDAHLAILNQQTDQYQNKFSFLNNYLSSVDTWGDLEWFLYSFILDECPVSMVTFRTRQAITLLSACEPSCMTPKALMRVIFHGIRFLYQNSLLDEAEAIIKAFDKAIKCAKYTTYINEHLALKCYSAIIMVLRHQPEGLELAKSCMTLFELFETDLEISHLNLSKNRFFTFIEKHRDKSIPFEW